MRATDPSSPTNRMDSVHHRQRGAASVNIFFFLVVLVLMLGALGFGWVQFNQRKEAEAKAAAARTEAQGFTTQRMVRDQALADLLKVVGEGGEYAGAKDFVWTEYGGPPQPLENVPSPELLKAKIQAFARDLDVPDTMTGSLSQLFEAAKASHERAKQQVAALEQNKREMQAAQDKLSATISDMTRAHADEVGKLNQAKSEQLATYDADRKKFEDTIAAQRVANTNLASEMNKVKEQWASDVLGYKNEVSRKDARISAQAEQMKLRNPAQAPDGRVISASAAAGKAWIDIGRNDMLQTGTVFRITAPGRSEIKAHGTVTRLDDNRAEIAISNLRDPYDPVVQGDQISNELYSPNMRRTVALLGRFGHPYTKSYVRSMLEKLGNRVVDKVGPSVDLVILGSDTVNEEGSGLTPLEESEAFKQVQFYGIETATVNKLRDLLAAQ